MIKIINKLVKIASELDQSYLFKEADKITNIMIKLADMESEGLEPGFQDIIDAAKILVTQMIFGEYNEGQRKSEDNLSYIQRVLPNKIKKMLLAGLNHGIVSVNDIVTDPAYSSKFFEFIEEFKKGNPKRIDNLEDNIHAILEVALDNKLQYLSNYVMDSIVYDVEGTTTLDRLKHNPLESLGYSTEEQKNNFRNINDEETSEKNKN